METYYPRKKGTMSHLLVLNRELTDSEKDNLGALIYGTGEYIYTFECAESDLGDVYIFVVNCLEDDRTPFLIFKIENRELVY